MRKNESHKDVIAKKKHRGNNKPLPKKREVTTLLIYGLSWKYGRCIQTREVFSKKPLFHLGKELEFINFMDTTAWCNFADIKFKGENKIYTEDINRFNFDVE